MSHYFYLLEIKLNLIYYYLSFKGDQWWDYWKNSKDIVEPLRYFASQIVCLRINQCFSSDVLNQINIIQFSSVRMLKLCQLNTSQLDAIQPHNFPYLEYLSLIETPDFSLKILCQFKTLRSCEMLSLEIDTKYSTISSSIQSMFLRHCHPREVHIYLRHFPMMISFQVMTYLSNDFADKTSPLINFVHSNLELISIHVLDVDSPNDGTNTDKYNLVSGLLTSLSFDKPIRYILTLVHTVNFDFEQFEHIVRQLDFVYFSCKMMWHHKSVTAPNIDCIRQIPAFNQLEILLDNPRVIFCRAMWRKTSISNH